MLQRVRAVGREFLRINAASDFDLIAAGVAFYGMFSVFPAIAALIALFGLVADPVVVEAQLNLMREVIPDDVFGLLNGQVSRLLEAGRTTLGWATAVSVGVALWSARAGVGAMIRGINAVHGVPGRGGVHHILAAVVLTLAIVAVAIVAMFAVVLAPIALAFLPIEAATVRMLEAIRWAVGLGVVMVALAIFYRYAPNLRGRRPVRVLPGIVVTLILWFAASWGLGSYLSRFADYNEIYGSIGAVVALLMWLYVSAYLVLFGAALNVALTAPSREAV